MTGVDRSTRPEKLTSSASRASPCIGVLKRTSKIPVPFLSARDTLDGPRGRTCGPREGRRRKGSATGGRQRDARSRRMAKSPASLRLCPRGGRRKQTTDAVVGDDAILFAQFAQIRGLCFGLSLVSPLFQDFGRTSSNGRGCRPEVGYPDEMHAVAGFHRASPRTGLQQEHRPSEIGTEHVRDGLLVDLAELVLKQYWVAD